MINKGGESLSVIKRGEIIHTNHNQEFMRFFDKHKRLCDEISGLKHHSIVNIDDVRKVIIGKENFSLAIKLLDTFITEFISYVYEGSKSNEIRSTFDELESEFINDGDYNKFIMRGDELSISQSVSFNKKYIYYLMKCFDISFMMSKYLQNSLNISIKEVVKNLQFVNYDSFFNNLSVYKGEVANSLANSEFSNLFETFKKILGFFYTYRYLVAVREQKHILDLLKLVYKYMMSDEKIRLLIKIKEGGVNSLNDVKSINEEFKFIRKAFNRVYDLVNRSMQMKNILPKTSKDVLVDNTLI